MKSKMLTCLWNKKCLILFVSFVSLFTSCDTFYQGMGGGGYGYGGYGMGTGLWFPGYTPPPALPSPQQIQDECARQVKSQTPVVNSGAVGTFSTYSSTPITESSSGSSTSSNSRDCRRCLGTGRCQTCNGKGYYDEIGIGSGRHACPNCASNHNGKCASCNGTGKM